MSDGSSVVVAWLDDIGDVVVESQPLIQYDAERLQSSGGWQRYSSHLNRVDVGRGLYCIVCAILHRLRLVEPVFQGHVTTGRWISQKRCKIDTLLVGYYRRQKVIYDLLNCYRQWPWATFDRGRHSLVYLTVSLSVSQNMNLMPCEIRPYQFQWPWLIWNNRSLRTHAPLHTYIEFSRASWISELIWHNYNRHIRTCCWLGQWRSDGGGSGGADRPGRHLPGARQMPNGRKIVLKKDYRHANSDRINLFAYEEQKILSLIRRAQSAS